MKPHTKGESMNVIDSLVAFFATITVGALLAIMFLMARGEFCIP